MKKSPKNGEPKIKNFNWKQWTWCIHHMAWGMHTPEECKLGKAQAQQRTTSIANQATVANSVIVPPSYASYASLLNVLQSSGLSE